jgi:hypothetical protein
MGSFRVQNDEATLSSSNIPLIETDDDVLIKRRLSSIEQDSLLLTPATIKQYSSTETFWSALLISVPLCTKLIHHMSKPFYGIYPTIDMNYTYANSISNRKKMCLILYDLFLFRVRCIGNYVCCAYHYEQHAK